MGIVTFESPPHFVRIRSRSLTSSKARIIDEARKQQPQFNLDLQSEIGEKPKNPPPPWDDCRLGYRWIPYFDLDSRTWEQAKVGLTPEDLLHPHFEDQVMHDKLFHEEANPIFSTLSCLLKEQVRDAIVVQDVLVHWQVPDFPHKHSPDIAVYYNYRREEPSATQFLVQDWGLEPRLIIEFLSHSSNEVRDNDLIHKVAEYHQVGLPQYIVANVTSQNLTKQIQILPYRWQPEGHVQQPLNWKGRIRLNLGEEVNIWLGTAREGRHQVLALFEGPSGRRIPTQALNRKEIATLRTRLETVEAEVLTERTRAEAAEARIAALEAHLQTHGVAPNAPNSG